MNDVRSVSQPDTMPFLGLSRDGVWRGSFENRSENSLKEDQSMDTKFNPLPLFSLVNTFKTENFFKSSLKINNIHVPVNDLTKVKRYRYHPDLIWLNSPFKFTEASLWWSRYSVPSHPEAQVSSAEAALKMEAMECRDSAPPVLMRTCKGVVMLVLYKSGWEL